jgi:hypothetical protein
VEFVHGNPIAAHPQVDPSVQVPSELETSRLWFSVSVVQDETGSVELMPH